MDNKFVNFIKKIKLGKLFYNNKFTLLFSLVCSFALWVLISSSDTEGVSLTISDIPVEISLSESAVQDGLRIFSGKDITAKVEVKGSRMAVGQLTKNDIQVTAPQAATTIRSPGHYTLGLSAKKVGFSGDYSITSEVKPSVITVMVDRYREAEFKIEPEIEFCAKKGYFVGSTSLSSSSVKISGPETEISKVKRIIVKDQIQGEMSESLNLKLPIIMLDVYNQPISSETINVDFSQVDVNIPILMKKEVSVKPKFSNVPSGIDLNKEYKDFVKVYPSKIEIAGPENVISGIDSVNLSEIDFKSLSMQNHRFNPEISLPVGCRTLNDVIKADVDVDMSPFREKTFTINDFSFVNVPENKNPKVYNAGINVKFIGPMKSVNLLKASDILAQIDFESKEDISDSMEMPVKLSVREFSDLWTNENYFVNVGLN